MSYVVPVVMFLVSLMSYVLFASLMSLGIAGLLKRFTRQNAWSFY